MPKCNDCNDWGDIERFIPEHLSKDRDSKGQPRVLYLVCPNCGSKDVQPTDHEIVCHAIPWTPQMRNNENRNLE